MWYWHQERDLFLYYSRLSLLLPRYCRCNPSSSSFAITLLLLPLLTPHFDNVAFNQLSLGILVYFDGQWDAAGGTISSLCQLHVIHPFNFPRCTSFGGQLYWNGWDLLWAMKCGFVPHPCSWESFSCSHVHWFLNPLPFHNPKIWDGRAIMGLVISRRLTEHNAMVHSCNICDEPLSCKLIIFRFAIVKLISFSLGTIALKN